ncbi:MAG: hypothetical protein QM495_08135 [Lutibacter sp.]|uniref:hypothetical protein n=1 Tax=Lutibacter sp. TaxID=1925666 RepID=UPI00385CA340
MKKIIYITTKVAVFVMLLSLTSCYYNDVYEYTPPVVTEVSFAIDIQPIFNENCIACHPAISIPDLTEGNSYNFLTVTDPDLVIPFDAEGSELYQRMISTTAPMPPSGKLSSKKTSLIKAWINDGAKDN